MRRWHVLMEGEVQGCDGPAEVEAFLAEVMDRLAEMVSDPGCGAALATGRVEIEFELTADTLEEARARARGVFADAVAAGGGGRLDPWREVTERVLEAV